MVTFKILLISSLIFHSISALIRVTRPGVEWKWVECRKLSMEMSVYLPQYLYSHMISNFIAFAAIRCWSQLRRLFDPKKETMELTGEIASGGISWNVINSFWLGNLETRTLGREKLKKIVNDCGSDCKTAISQVEKKIFLDICPCWDILRASSFMLP